MPTFTSVFVAGLVALMIGALCSRPLADRFGRKLVLLTLTLIVSVLALATALAHSIDQLWVLRLFTGIGVESLEAAVGRVEEHYDIAKHCGSGTNAPLRRGQLN